MDDYRQIILGAEPGQIVPIVKRIEMTEPVDFFAKVSDYGRAKNCCLFESREHLPGYTALSFGTSKPALYITGTGADFSIRALSMTGRRMIEYLSTRESHFDFCESVEFDAEAINGKIEQSKQLVDEQTRLKTTNPVSYTHLTLPTN